MKGVLKTKPDKKQLADAALALILVCLLVFLFSKSKLALYLSIASTILAMLDKRIFYPWAVFWFTITELFGNIVSRVLLTVIYILFVWTVGLFRKLIGKDTMQIKKFGKSIDSAFTVREKTYIAKDLENPY